LPADALAKKRAAGRRFYVAHRDQVLAGIEAIRQRTKAADPELYRANHRLAQKRWKASNQELAKVGEKRRRDRVATDTKRAYAVKWRAENPDRSRAIGRNKESNRRATKRAAFVEPIDHAVVYARDRGVCGICQAAIAAGDKWHVDHVIPLAKGGVHSYANVQLAHARCNLRKSARVA
jgi:5-methylcytosine-specific restriction endonuclease McrA